MEIFTGSAKYIHRDKDAILTKTLFTFTTKEENIFFRIFRQIASNDKSEAFYKFEFKFDSTNVYDFPYRFHRIVSFLNVIN